jgi:hypothetical protein
MWVPRLRPSAMAKAQNQRNERLEPSSRRRAHWSSSITVSATMNRLAAYTSAMPVCDQKVRENPNSNAPKAEASVEDVVP